MSPTTSSVINWGILSLICLGLMVVFSSFGGDRKAAEGVSEAVVHKVMEGPHPNAKEWISIGARVSWGLFLLLVCFLGFGLWLFICRVAYADSDLIRPHGQLRPGENPIPHPDKLPLEGD